MAKKVAEPDPKYIEYIKKFIAGKATDQDFLILSPQTNTAKGLKKTLGEVRAAIEYLKPAA